MIDIIEEGRAVKADEALEVLKSDLKALNSSVAVEQEEYDEIMAIKPMFLVREYTTLELGSLDNCVYILPYPQPHS